MLNRINDVILLTGVHITTFITLNYMAFINKKHAQSIPLWVPVTTCMLFVLGTIHIIGSIIFVFDSWRNGHNMNGGPKQWMRDHNTDVTPILARGSLSVAFTIQHLVVVRYASV